MRKLRFLLSAGLVLPFLFLFALAGCAPKVVKPPPAMPSLPPADILKKISERIPVDAAIRSRARFSVDSPKGKLSTGIVLLAKRPCFLRIESISLLGLPDLILTANERDLRIYSVKEDKFYIGSASENLSRYFPIHLDPAEAVQLILGLPPDLKELKTVARGSVEGELYRIDILSNGERIRCLWLDPSDLTLRRIEKLERGERIYTAELSEYKEEGLPIPGRIDIQFDRPDRTKVSIRYPGRELTRAESADFELEPPAGMTPIHLD